MKIVFLFVSIILALPTFVEAQRRVSTRTKAKATSRVIKPSSSKPTISSAKKKRVVKATSSSRKKQQPSTLYKTAEWGVLVTSACGFTENEFTLNFFGISPYEQGVKSEKGVLLGKKPDGTWSKDVAINPRDLALAQKFITDVKSEIEFFMAQGQVRRLQNKTYQSSITFRKENYTMTDVGVAKDIIKVHLGQSTHFMYVTGCNAELIEEMTKAKQQEPDQGTELAQDGNPNRLKILQR